MTKLLNLLTVCRKAGQLKMGFDPMKDALAEGKARAVLTAADISEKTEKETRFFADKQNVPVKKTAVTLDEVCACMGKRAGILTICESGFAERALAICEDENNSKD